MSPQEARRLRRTLYVAAFLRALGVGLMAVLILLDTGYAAGGLLAALPALLEAFGFGTLQAMRASLALFCVLYAAATLLYARLPRELSGVAPVTLGELSPKSRPIVMKISLLFLL